MCTQVGMLYIYYGCRRVYTYIRIIGGSFVLCVFFLSPHTHKHTRVYNFFPHRDYYYTVVRIYTYSVYIHTETAMSLSSGERGRGRHKNTHIYIRIRRGELARRSIKGWSRGNSYSVQYSQWMISALTWLL